MDLKFRQGWQSEFRSQVHPHGVHGWSRYVISRPRNPYTMLLDQYFQDGKETPKITRPAIDQRMRKHLKTSRILRKWFAAWMAQLPKWGVIIGLFSSYRFCLSYKSLIMLNFDWPADFFGQTNEENGSSFWMRLISYNVSLLGLSRRIFGFLTAR